VTASTKDVDLVFVWHHHQPDYRHPRDGRALLPWVRLHASKDYLDMALHLERHPGVHATFNFAPSLLAQIEDVLAGGADALFALLAAEPGTLSPAARAELQARTRIAPGWARERWPAYRALIERLRAPAVASDAELLRASVWFLLAWLDPLLLEEPEAAAIERAALAGELGMAQRDALLALHARALARVLPAYAALARTGQVELACSPAYHPILPLLIDVKSGRRSRPDQPSPAEPFEAPLDAQWQIEQGLARTERTFGIRPAGMWPSEGSVSPEAAALLAGAGVRWIGTDEQVLWASLPSGTPRAELHQPWRFESTEGPIAIFFRDHGLSDRIGFVYSTWKAADAVADFMRQLRRIGQEHADAGRPGRAVVSVILDGENCWETYAEDGRPFVEALYAALEAAPDIRTRTPSEVLAEGGPIGTLARLHSGSWIDADFHIWVGHPEKNHAWDLLARTRAALVAAGATRESRPAAWEALAAAEGSDWFWWFGEDHYTADKAMFDSLFRANLQAALERAELPVPAWVSLPIIGTGGAGDVHHEPTALIRPVIDGRVTRYYEWAGAGLWRIGTGGTTMHRVSEPVASALHYGFDEESLYLRIDFAGEELPGDDAALVLEVVAPETRRLRIDGLSPGRRAIVHEDHRDAAPAGHAVIDDVLEARVTFAALGLGADQPLELLLHLERAGERLESLPPGEVLRLRIPGSDWEGRHWSA
jgi:alpha-amylase/alpha-mannosidase (GH57 family)